MANLAYFIILYCAARSAAAPGVTRVGYMGLCVRVWYADVPHQWFAFGLWEEKCSDGFVSEE